MTLKGSFITPLKNFDVPFCKGHLKKSHPFPNSVSVSEIIRETDSRSLMLHVIPWTRPPSHNGRRCSTAFSILSGFRDAMTRSLPRRANDSAIPSPIPLPPPVTRLHFPANNPGRKSLCDISRTKMQNEIRRIEGISWRQFELGEVKIILTSFR